MAYIQRHARRKLEEERSEEVVTPPEPDIQAMLTVVGRRHDIHRNRDIEQGPIDLHGTDLRRSHLRKAHLERANLRRVNLYGADLCAADFRGADLREANLYCAELKYANLARANLQEANLLGANLQGAVLAATSFEGARLLRANLQYAKLFAITKKEDVSKVWDLDEIDTALGVVRTRLMGADFEGANGLTKEQLEQAVGDETTKLPHYLLKDPPSWSKKPVEEADED